MKYIKYFESEEYRTSCYDYGRNLKESDVLDIQEMFRDIADDYNLEKVDNINDSENGTYKIHTECMFSGFSPTTLDTMIHIESIELTLRSNNIKLFNVMESFKKRLEGIGYKARFSIFNLPKTTPFQIFKENNVLKLIIE